MKIKQPEIIFFFLLILNSIGCTNTTQNSSQTTTEENTPIVVSLESPDNAEVTAKKIITCCFEKNFLELNTRFYNSEYKVIALSKNGAFTRYKLVDFVGNIENAFSSVSENPSSIENTPIAYDCDINDWKQKGFFYFKDTSISTYLGYLYQAEKENDFEPGISVDKQKTYTDLLKKETYKIIYTPADLVFYITLIDNKYYITVVDNVLGYCGS